MRVTKGNFVRIYNVILKPEERTALIPEDTKKTPLEMWVKGFLQEDAKIGEIVEILTITGRKVKGTLVELNPTYKHNYGELIPELFQIGIKAREILFGGKRDE